MKALTASGVVAGYGGAPIVHGASVEVDDGNVVTLVGPNGAGKSTLIKALCGLLKISEGTVAVGGESITNLPAHTIARRGVAYVPQNDNVFPSLSIVENLEMGAFTRTSGTQERIEEVLSIFPDLRSAGKKKAGALSGGQRNMLGMARALMLDPRVIMLDEPTAGLSPQYTEVVWQQIEAVAAHGTATLVVEQNVDHALRHSQYAYVLVAGRNHLHGPSDEVARHDLAAIFLGHAEGVAAANGSRKETST